MVSNAKDDASRVMHSTELTPDQTTACCGVDPRTLDAFAEDSAKVTCKKKEN